LPRSPPGRRTRKCGRISTCKAISPLSLRSLKTQKDADIIKSYDIHANSYIQKPVHLSEFIEMIKLIEDFWFGIVKLPPR